MERSSRRPFVLGFLVAAVLLAAPVRASSDAAAGPVVVLDITDARLKPAVGLVMWYWSDQSSLRVEGLSQIVSLQVAPGGVPVRLVDAPTVKCGDSTRALACFHERSRSVDISVWDGCFVASREELAFRLGHEVGHIIGLGHSNVTGSVMVSSWAGGRA